MKYMPSEKLNRIAIFNSVFLELDEDRTLENGVKKSWSVEVSELLTLKKKTKEMCDKCPNLK